MVGRRRPIRLRWQRCSRAIAFSPLLLTAMILGCVKDTGGHLQHSQAAVMPPTTAATPYPSLAGTWKYEESGQTILITLNEYGRGTYDWKDGQFITTTFSGGVWKGFWSQRDNDRDGEFEVTFMQNAAKGQGRWWYTRIGSDTAPSRPGGVFQIARQSPPSPSSQASGASGSANDNRQVRSRERR
ncbi:hypothetical protein [Nitrospira sp. Nam74]